MKRKGNPTYDVLPPYWPRITIMLVGLIALIIIENFFGHSPSSLWEDRKRDYAYIAATLFLYYDFRSYHVSDEGIRLLRFGIPYRFISWEKVEQVAVITSHNSKQLLITICGTTPFRPNEPGSRDRIIRVILYWYRHPIGTILFDLNERKNAAQIIEKHYSGVEHITI